MRLADPVFIHGWGFSSKVFSGFKGIKVDLPGHGRSRDPYISLEDTARKIALSLPGKHDLIGWSLGGSLAVMITVMFPTKVRRLFLIGTTPHFRKAWKEANIRAFRVMVKREGISAFRRMAFDGNFEDHVSMDTAMRILDDYIDLDLTGMMTALRKETFIIHGTEDRVVPVKEAFRTKNLIRGSKLIILPGGHLPVRDESEFVFKVFKVGVNLRQMGGSPKGVCQSSD